MQTVLQRLRQNLAMHKFRTVEADESGVKKRSTVCWQHVPYAPLFEEQGEGAQNKR